MTTEYELIHTTTYSYDAEVTASYGQAHLAPAEIAGQRVRCRQLIINPGATDIREHIDYFGNVSTFFLVTDPHTELSVTARSEVSVTRQPLDYGSLDGLSWRQVAGQTAEDAMATEFQLDSPRIRRTPDLTDYAETIFTPERSFGAAIAELVHRIHDDFRYRSGVTTVLTDISSLLRARAGVCQDFAHLAVGCLRTVGLAARYVSGYLETVPAAGQAKLRGADASHAWVSVFAPGIGWVDLDPTNNKFVDERYVVAACGRDYGDVPPLKGVIVTAATKSSMRVSVDVSRVG